MQDPSTSQIVLAVIGAISALILLGYFPRRIATHRVDDITTAGAAEWSFTGGGTWVMSWWLVGATWPLVRMDVFSSGLRLGPRTRWIAWALPTTEILWSDITTAKDTFWGLRIRSRSFPRGWVAFNSAKVGFPRIDEGLLLVLKQYGVIVE